MSVGLDQTIVIVVKPCATQKRNSGFLRIQGQERTVVDGGKGLNLDGD